VWAIDAVLLHRRSFCARALLLMPLVGCAAITAHRPDPDRGLAVEPDCNAGRGGATADVALAFATGLGAGAAAGGNDGGAALALAATSLLFSASAIYGATSAGACQEAMAAAVARRAIGATDEPSRHPPNAGRAARGPSPAPRGTPAITAEPAAAATAPASSDDAAPAPADDAAPAPADDAAPAPADDAATPAPAADAPVDQPHGDPWADFWSRP
jgi:hypothetical protein